MSKKFSYAGVSTLNGVCKVRFGNDESRAKVLAHRGHTDVKLKALDKPMSREEAIIHLYATRFMRDDKFARATLAAAAKMVEAPAAKAKPAVVVSAETEAVPA
jgi:hypothetical protein